MTTEEETLAPIDSSFGSLSSNASSTDVEAKIDKLIFEVYEGTEVKKNISNIYQEPESPAEINCVQDESRKAREYTDLGLQRCSTKAKILTQMGKDQAVSGSSLTIDRERPLVINEAESFKTIDPELVTWAFDSPDNPRNWRLSKKVYVVLVVSLYTFVSPISASIMSPAANDLAQDFNITSPTVQALVTSIHILAWVFGPLVIAPLSENGGLGRRKIMNWTCWITFFFNLACGFSQNITQLLILRFCSGLFSAIPLNVSPAAVSDMFDAKNRNTSLAGVFLIPFVGAALAPVIGGFVVEAKGWRWVLFTLAIINGVIAITGSFFFLETYAPALLLVKAKRLRKVTGNKSLRTVYELSGDGLSFEKVKENIKRPLILLFTNPLVFGLGSFLAFIYGFLYLMIVTFPSVFQKSYEFSQSTAGLMFLALCIAFVLGVVSWTIALEYVYDRLVKKHGVEKPEFRLPCLFLSAMIMAIGLFWYGWSAQYKLHWIMPCVGSGIFAFGMVCPFQTLQAYLIDMNPAYAASSLAAASVFRFAFGFSFPLFANAMYDKMGYGWGNTMCGILALVLGIPFPYLCFRYGDNLRAWSNERMEKSEEKRRHRMQANV